MAQGSSEGVSPPFIGVGALFAALQLGARLRDWHRGRIDSETWPLPSEDRLRKG